MPEIINFPPLIGMSRVFIHHRLHEAYTCTFMYFCVFRKYDVLLEVYKSNALVFKRFMSYLLITFYMSETVHCILPV